jgi:hypothetical protein
MMDNELQNRLARALYKQYCTVKHGRDNYEPWGKIGRERRALWRRLALIAYETLTETHQDSTTLADPRDV